ncbi:MAG: hypothetical protein AABX07_04495 [Nanoarchaeota archaeon]
MKTKGLNLAGIRLNETSDLIKAIKALPDKTIEGLSESDSNSVSLKDDKIVIKRYRGFGAGLGSSLTVNFPEDSKNNVARYGVASFEYKGQKYEIHL